MIYNSSGDFMEDIKILQKLIDESENIVFFGGAGVSTASGIPDFRSKDGLYNLNYKYPPEEILEHNFFMNNPKEFYEFYINKLNCLDKEPNICHKYLTNLEKCGKLKAIITQNIDSLHTKAGSKNVIELHGNIYRNHCLKCGKSYKPEYIFNSNNVPTCSCGGIIKPDVTLYGERLDDNVVNETIIALSKADLLIIAGTSLNVYPARNFINYFNGNKIVIINLDTTPYDNIATLVIHKPITDVFKKLKN